MEIYLDKEKTKPFTDYKLDGHRYAILKDGEFFVFGDSKIKALGKAIIHAYGKAIVLTYDKAKVIYNKT